MPIVEDIYEPNYGVDRGNGAIPIEFYINKWEFQMDLEIQTMKET